MRGFTLIELMIVITIIGILATIGIQEFWRYREEAMEASALNDLRNIMTAEEAEFASEGRYSDQGCGQGPAWLFNGTKHVSKGVGYCVNATSDRYAAFTGAKGTNREFGAGSDDEGIFYKRVSNPHIKAQSETTTTISGWGGQVL